jgi:hypothetical protein
MTHAIKNLETYERTYFVQADTFDEAREKLEDAIQNGKINGPEECSDTEYINDSEGWDPDYFNDPVNLDLK